MHIATTSPSKLPTMSTSITDKAAALLQGVRNLLNAASPAVDLLIRVMVGLVFFQAGLTKISNWNSTVSLFENVYAVPFLPPEVAAFMGTAVELFFPVLLVLGIGTRFAAAVLFVFNIIAVISYPDLSEVGLKDHQTWGLLLLVTLLHGPGKLSLDHLLGSRLTSNAYGRFFGRRA